MHFTVFAFSTIPDIATARHNFGLHSLSDEDVAKVLFHQRKQRTGNSEALTWDQLAMASLSVVEHRDAAVHLHSYVVGEHTEQAVLAQFLQAYVQTPLAVCWQQDFALLNFRLLKQSLYDPAYWQARQSQAKNLGLAQWFATGAGEALLLDDIAQRFYLPGMQQQTLDTVWDAYLQQDLSRMAQYSDYQALNTYLLTLKVLPLQGRLKQAEAQQAAHKFKQNISGQYVDFVKHWDDNL